MIRISQIREGSKQRFLVEGTLSDGWVDVLEDCWLKTTHTRNGQPMRIDLSGVTYVDEKGSEPLGRMIQAGAELRATGVMAQAVIEEAMERVSTTHQGKKPDGT